MPLQLLAAIWELIAVGTIQCNLHQERIPWRVFLFDIGKIISVESSISDESAIIEVDYGEYGGICKVDLLMSDYVSDMVTISDKSSQLRLLE